MIVSKSVAHYAVRLVRGTRPQETDRDYVKHYLTWGAGPRACQSLLLGAKARALLDGRPHVSLDDVRSLAKPVLRHRIVTSFAAESENINSDDVVDQLFPTCRKRCEARVPPGIVPHLQGIVVAAAIASRLASRTDYGR